MHHFAGPVFPELPLSGKILLLIIQVIVLFGLAVLVKNFFKFSLSIRSRNYVAAKERPDSTNVINIYITALLIDAGITALLVGLLSNLGVFGTWDNDVWHTVAILYILAVVALRVFSRLFIKITPGEKFLSLPPQRLNRYTIQLVAEVLVAVFIIAWIVSL